MNTDKRLTISVNPAVKEALKRIASKKGGSIYSQGILVELGLNMLMKHINDNNLTIKDIKRLEFEYQMNENAWFDDADFIARLVEMNRPNKDNNAGGVTNE